MPPRAPSPPKPPPLPRAARTSKPPKAAAAPRARTSKPPKPAALPSKMPPLPKAAAAPKLVVPPPLPVDVPMPPPAPVSTFEAKGARSLLVVEDDEATRRLMVRALRTAYTVYEAANGEQAARMLDAHPGVDCVVSDIMMPKLTGTELADKMKSDPRLAKVPIVFVTAKKGAGEGMEGIKYGAGHFLRKPFKLRDLLEKVASVIEKPW
jgi:CheY-like chemotaxis protein